MEIAIRTRNVRWSEELQNRVERSISFAVDRHRCRIGRVTVYLMDVNGPRGGVDKLCQLTAVVQGSRPVQILERGDDLLAAVKRAARRLGYRVARTIHRRRTPGARGYRKTIRAA